DQAGLYLGRRAGLGSVRLSIIDVDGGQQPIANEDRTLWIVFNGEIFNYVELRPELEARGHRFRTGTDTEVVLHAFEEFGPRCLDRFNGQFALAIWDTRKQSLFLARDRMGVRPLFYTTQGGRLVFASEIKAILADRRLSVEIDPVVLDQVFTFWSPLTPQTIFRNIVEVPPGHYLVASATEIALSRYWDLNFPAASGEPVRRPSPATLEAYAQELAERLTAAVQARLRADVPVGAYLSGGLDSSMIAAITRQVIPNRLQTFSIAFNDTQYDEHAYQTRMAQCLGVEHHVAHVSHADIGRVFPEVIWHVEVPLMRTAPAPMFILSEQVHAHGFKVVLTGEGADEFFAGYDIFKEAKVRRFWARRPESHLRPKLFERLYADVIDPARSPSRFLVGFFRQHLLEVGSPTYSHAVRWWNNRRTCRFFDPRVVEAAGAQADAAARQLLPSHVHQWPPLAQAQYLEARIFLSQYLLSSQGDRVAMAHSVEGRFPFLDHRLVEFCNRLPEPLKLRGLKDKYLLRKLAEKWLPPTICHRPKHPYRAPIRRSFFTPASQDYVRELLSPGPLQASGLFDLVAVRRLVQKAESDRPLGETDDMALAGIISTQLLHHRFIDRFVAQPLPAGPRLKVCLDRDTARSHRVAENQATTPDLIAP
ncbi:MAG: asparagine synthase (glutamine-hydrolyzing), partial [Verrucomicrobia bacterium]|nr:asparagine synthase (glutamine-hydrolyzing) [Verrucomicrobiota bacterium]